MRDYFENENISSIIVENLDPDYHFKEMIKTNALPNAFLELVRKESLEGYFSFKANLHMLTNKTLIFPRDEDAFCIILDRDHSIGIIGFTKKDQLSLFNEFCIGDILDYLTINFGGDDLPNSLKDELHKNWKL